MKLNKFLAVAVAATVLPLSVAHAEGPAVNDVPEFKGGVNPADAPVLEKPEFKGGVNPADAPVLEKPEFKGGVNGEGTTAEPKYKVRPDGVVYNNGDDQGRAAVHNVPEFKGGVNGAEPAVLDKPEFKLPAGRSSDDTFGPRKGQAPAKAQNGHKTLPKTSAVK